MNRLQNKSSSAREKRYHVVRLSSGEAKVVSYFIHTKSDKDNASESDNNKPSEAQESDITVNESAAASYSSSEKQSFKTKDQCFASFKRTLKRYNYIAKNHAFPRLKSGYVFTATFTLASPINSFYEMQA